MTIDSISSEDNPRLSENTSLPGASATACNGATGSPSTNSSNNNVNNIRKTLAKWLRLQKRNPSSQRRPRYKLIGWPPKWVRRRSHSPVANRALPPVPPVQSQAEDERHERVSTPEMQPEDFPPGVAYLPEGEDDDEDHVFESKSDEIIDFAASIETVKNCDWYWGPISGTAAEQALEYEPDGSFLVRDSSDDRYIFSLTFKLNGTVRHVRIEHDQGNFSFGSFTRFKSNTIVDFVENAVEHSRSGRYLFFLNRRPTNGPMRVQLLHPVSRVKKVQSLQHMCRFVILKLVPRDHVDQLPVPKRIKDYLKTPNYYSENITEEEEDEVDIDIKSPEAEAEEERPLEDTQNYAAAM